ncbi:carbohydrate sulfotransferase 11-like isoform X1 [Strongylocentrotus purpuratus]|uniref:Carbohydrate sulfotransferase n=1 Tax=Strongylocentrotus purpuratus TaxID=7668 RepID=A0A7M7PML4_STRPU|nr:carbohydrate sulfotransferase 11-like isoform X1 [Strongylocentrotus purpuratus]
MSSKMEHKPRRLYFLEIMSTRKNVIVVVGIIVLLILINLGFVLRGLLDISSDPVYKPKARFRNEEQDERISTIGTLYDSVINLSTNAPVDKMTSSNIFFMDEQDAIQKARRAQVSHTCIKNSSGGTFTDFMKLSSHYLIVDEKYKLIYCSVPKVASTSWKRVLLVLRGIMKDTYDLSQSDVNNKVAPQKLKYLRFYPEEDIRRMLKEFTKFLVVRDPFSRILSAFRNKLDPLSDFRKCDIWQKGIGMHILKKYKPQSLIGPSRPVFKRLSTPKGVVRYDLNMADFVKFLVDPLEKNDEEHWSEIHKLCSPCLVEYDIISKFETLDTDAEYILRRIHADSIVQFPSSIGSSPTNSSNTASIKSYFKDVPRSDLDKLYRRYQLDFELFGYDNPDMGLS